eukprot:jgi/Tetstr1/462735/TSEL_007697.t1
MPGLADAGHRPKVVIAGGGNAAHVAAGMFAKQGADVRMYVSLPEEAKEIRDGVAANGGITVHKPADTDAPEESYTAAISPDAISSNPADVIPDAELVIIITPAFAHEPILRQIEPHVHHEVFVGAIPAPGGFQWMAEHILRDSASGLTVFGGDHLPWACRIEEKGKSVSLLGVKSHVDVCVHPHGKDTDLFSTLNRLFVGTTYTDGGHFLNCTLFPTNCIIHPGIMYGLWHDWDGQPVTEAPLFYQGLSQQTADLLEGMSDDIQATKKALEAALSIDLSLTLPVYDYQMQVYGHNIDDSSSLRTVFRTNHAFRGLTCPMDKLPDGLLVPAFGCRYLTEDLPYGLAVLKGIAELAGVDTPHFDKVLAWAQDKIGHVYIGPDKRIVAGSPDVQRSGCPQRWGYTSMEDLRDSFHDTVTAQ